MPNKKNVLITGANGGIGSAITKIFAQNDYNIIAHARNYNETFEKYLNELSSKYAIETTPIYFDMTDSEKMKSVIKDIYSKKMPVDVLVNNAGIAHVGFFQMTPISKIREVFDVNLFSQMELTQLILKLMIKQKNGSIINISSIAGLDLKDGNCAYGVSKAAMIAWTKSLSKECTKYNIRVNSIAPGLTDTKLAEYIKEKSGMDITKESLMERLSNPCEIAEAVFFLASDKASFINGQILRVDGGKI